MYRAGATDGAGLAVTQSSLRMGTSTIFNMYLYNTRQTFHREMPFYIPVRALLKSMGISSMLQHQSVYKEGILL